MWVALDGAQVATPLNIPVELAFGLTLDLETATLHDLQREMRREARRAMLRALRTAVGQVERILVARGVACAACNHPMRSRGRTKRRIVTVFGTVDVARARYRCVACGAVRRPLDEWIGALAGSEYTAAVREQVLFLSADLPYERAAEVLRHVGGIGISGRQIQRLLEAESEHIDAAIAGPAVEEGEPLRRRFRRAGKRAATPPGAERVLKLRRLRSSGLWEQYWARRFRADAEARNTARPS
jgi:DNA-directed RNA polymerase subunit RPC12/RpoP